MTLSYLSSGTQTNILSSFKMGALRENGVVKWIRYPAYPDKDV
ncbi:hypothetical protein ACA081_00520 [Candidatus Hodgkinia cicadicola]